MEKFIENKTWKKILFLDIDGVLASYDYLLSLKGFIDKKKVALLNMLKPYDVEVVISSSWGYNEDTVKQLTACGLELPIIGGTEHFYNDWMCRGNEIAKWLVDTFDEYNVYTGKASSYSGKDYEYVILDDDEDILMCQKDNFIHVDRYTALTEENIKKAIDILERKNLKK
jgi:hypothetical protein